MLIKDNLKVNVIGKKVWERNWNDVKYFIENKMRHVGEIQIKTTELRDVLGKSTSQALSNNQMSGNMQHFGYSLLNAVSLLP